MHDNCWNSPALPPVVQNKINGMKVCAKRSDQLSFATAKRPEGEVIEELEDINIIYNCPSGYKPCNKDLLSSQETAEKAICIEELLEFAEHCPITNV